MQRVMPKLMLAQRGSFRPQSQQAVFPMTDRIVSTCRDCVEGACSGSFEGFGEAEGAEKRRGIGASSGLDSGKFYDDNKMHRN